MRRSILFLALVLIFSGKNSFAQHLEANIWYFGNHAGLDFNSGSPIAGAGSQLNTLEGCVTMSDRNTGELLFYSDGVRVWNRYNLQMPNGFGLWGHPSSTQSAVVIPDPDSSTKYYLFTVPAQAGYVNGISSAAYSIIDMTLEGGLGDVTLKNQPLLDPAVEKITAVRHCNGSDYWVIMHKWNSNEFYSYFVSASGIAAPVISAAGDSIRSAGSPILAETIGYMKFSPKGNRLAMASFSPLNEAQLFDFDNTTGVVSNPISLTIPPTPSSGYGGPYGVSFSPDGTCLYVVWHTQINPPNPPNYVFQFDLTGNDSASINSSRTIVAFTNVKNYGALQLATDGKLYLSTFSYSQSNPNAPLGSPTIDVIPNPNVQGLGCGWIPNAVSLASNTYSIWGLPNFIESYFSSDALSLGPDLFLAAPFSVTLDAGMGFASYLWSDGSTTQTINASAYGTYWVTVTSQNGCVQTDTLNIFGPVSVQENESIQNFNLFYPESNSFVLSFNSMLKQDLSINIFSVDGKLLFQKFYSGFNGLFRQEYSLNFPKGVYLLSVNTETNSKNVKLLVR